MKAASLLIILSLFLTGCFPGKTANKPAIPAVPLPTEEPVDLVHPLPAFDHVVMIVLENRDYKAVIGSKQMPYFNTLANKYVLFTHYYAVSHPSLPNYIAMIGGSTFNITSDCNNCFINQPSLPDLIEKSGRTWKTYQEDMPSDCFVGDTGSYMQKHNPFIYFDPIRTDTARCKQHVVPLSQLDTDIKNNQLPNFIFITPNMCHSGHDCGLDQVDQWLQQIGGKLIDSPALGEKSAILVTFDEGSDGSPNTCCGLKSSGGQVAAVLISPLAKNGSPNSQPYSHYSFLKTILHAWNLPELGFTANPATDVLEDVWK